MEFFGALGLVLLIGLSGAFALATVLVGAFVHRARLTAAILGLPAALTCGFLLHVFLAARD